MLVIIIDGARESSELSECLRCTLVALHCLEGELEVSEFLLLVKTHQPPINESGGLLSIHLVNNVHTHTHTRSHSHIKTTWALIQQSDLLPRTLYQSL